VLELATEEVGDGRETNMGMRACVDAPARDELSRSHLVEEDERPDHLALRRRKRAANLKAPMSRDRGTTKGSMASTATASGQMGSSEGFQLISASIPANFRDRVKER
jgi:hypothetical protein